MLFLRLVFVVCKGIVFLQKAGVGMYRIGKIR